jgi:hypothetical protein
MRGPGLAGLRLDVRESGARRRIGNADQVVAGGTLNLASAVAGIALQRLITVGTVEFEFISAHNLHLYHAQIRRQKYTRYFFRFSKQFHKNCGLSLDGNGC